VKSQKASERLRTKSEAGKVKREEAKTEELRAKS
jgi:hypothetical protein